MPEESGDPVEVAAALETKARIRELVGNVSIVTAEARLLADRISTIIQRLNEIESAPAHAPCQPSEADMMSGSMATSIPDDKRNLPPIGELNSRMVLLQEIVRDNTELFDERIVAIEEFAKSQTDPGSDKRELIVKGHKIEGPLATCVMDLNERIIAIETKDLPPDTVLGKLDPDEPDEERSMPPVTTKPKSAGNRGFLD